MFDIWRASSTGKTIQSIISVCWNAKNKCLDYINNSTESSFSYSVFCAPYKFCNKTRLRGYSFIFIAVLFMFLETNPIFPLVGFTYILYVFRMFSLEKDLNMLTRIDVKRIHLYSPINRNFIRVLIFIILRMKVQQNWETVV